MPGWIRVNIDLTKIFSFNRGFIKPWIHNKCKMHLQNRFDCIIFSSPPPYSLCVFKRTKYRKNSSADLMLVFIPSWCIESKNMHYFKIQRALFEGRARLPRKVLPKGPYRLCYLAGSSKRAQLILIFGFLASTWYENKY